MVWSATNVDENERCQYFNKLIQKQASEKYFCTQSKSPILIIAKYYLPALFR